MDSTRCTSTYNGAEETLLDAVLLSRDHALEHVTRSVELVRRAGADSGPSACPWGIDGDVRLMGFVSNVAPLLKQMDLLVFTSDHEGLPMTLLEAMALGVPVLSRDLVTIRKLLCNGRCGYFVSSDNAAEFVCTLQNLLDDRELLKVKANDAMQTMKSNYGIESKISEYVDLYKQVVS